MDWVAERGGRFLHKAFKDLIEILLGNAKTGVFDGHTDFVIEDTALNCDFSFFREFDGIP